MSQAEPGRRARSSAAQRGPLPETLDRLPRPPRSRWTSFIADPDDAPPRTLHEAENPSHRARVEHSGHTILVHLSDEDGSSWTVLAVDRASRRWAVGQARRQRDAVEEAFRRLYED